MSGVANVTKIDRGKKIKRDYFLKVGKGLLRRSTIRKDLHKASSVNLGRGPCQPEGPESVEAEWKDQAVWCQWKNRR